jgi:hypothetical protein
MPTAADPACAQTAATSLWSMLRTAAPAVADWRSCGLISAAAVGSGGDSRISKAAAWIWRKGGRPMRERRPSTTRRRRGRRRRWEWSCVAPGGVEIDLPGGGADEGSGRLRGSIPNLMSCRKNRLRIIVGCIALCLSAGIEYKSLEEQDTSGYIC